MLTPLDVRKKEFRRCFRGYDEQEVDQFLDHVIDTMEKLIEQNTEQQEHLERVEGTVAHYKELEDVLKSTMLMAQKTAKEIKDSADQESESILGDSQAKAKELLRQATEESDEKLRRATEASEERLRKASSEVENMLAKAREEAEAILDQARRDATRVLDEAAGKVDRMMDEYEALQKQAKVFRAKFRSFMQIQLEMLDAEMGRVDVPEWPALEEPVDDYGDDVQDYLEESGDDEAAASDDEPEAPDEYQEEKPA